MSVATHVKTRRALKSDNKTVDLVNRGALSSTQLDRPGQQNISCSRLTSNNGKFGEKRRVWRDLKIASLNVRATLDAGRLYQLESGCQEHDIDIVAVQEHRLHIDNDKQIDEVKLDSGGLFYFATGKKRGQGGVGLLLNKKASKRLLFVDRISDRILIAYIEAKPNIVVIAVYGPTNCSIGDETAEEERDNFYRQLEATITSIPPHNIVVIAGDLNARVGSDSCVDHPTVVGPHAFHDETNENGERLVSLCESTNLFLCHSRFPHRSGRKWTWRHAGGAKAQLDHIIMRTKWINSMRNCRAYSTLNLGSDHRIVCATIRVSLRTTLKKTTNTCSTDWSRLRDDHVKSKFNIEVANKFRELKDELVDKSTQNEYDVLLETIKQAADKTIGERLRPNKKPWVSEKTNTLVAAKERAHVKLAAKSTTEFEKARTLREDVRKLASEVAKSLIEDENQNLEQLATQLEEADRKHDPRTTWKLIRKIAGKDVKRLIKARSENKSSSERQILADWRRYFDDLLNSRAKNSTQHQQLPPPSHQAEQIRLVDPNRFDTSPFTDAEVSRAIKPFKNNKAPGTDSYITTELLKEGGDYLRRVLCDLCNAILSGADPPWQWTTNRIVPIPKKGDLSLMTNYRGISRMSVAAKLFNRLLLDRIRPHIDPILRKNQAGFRRGRSTTDQIGALRRIFEGAQEKQISLVATFVDFKKAFDSVDRGKLFEILPLYGIPSKLIEAAKKLYTNTRATVIVNGKETEKFVISSGVLQGDVLAPFFFIIVVDHVMRQCERHHGWIYRLRQSRRHPDLRINDLDFADDIVLLANSIVEACEQLEALRAESAKVGLIINEKKTEFMAFNCDTTSKVQLDDKPLNQVEDFKYLGSMMMSSWSDFNARRGQAYTAFNQLDKIWRSKNISLDLKMRILDASVMSILLYGCESWIVDNRLEAKINVFGLDCYRTVIGLTRLDKTRNEVVLSLVKRPLLSATVRKRQLGWLGHVMRRADDEPAKIFALYQPKERHGKHRVGRPAVSYNQQIAKALGVSVEYATPTHIAKLAENKKEWSKITAAQERS